MQATTTSITRWQSNAFWTTFRFFQSPLFYFFSSFLWIGEQYELCLFILLCMLLLLSFHKNVCAAGPCPCFPTYNMRISTPPHPSPSSRHRHPPLLLPPLPSPASSFHPIFLLPPRQSYIHLSSIRPPGKQPSSTHIHLFPPLRRPFEGRNGGKEAPGNSNPDRAA